MTLPGRDGADPLLFGCAIDSRGLSPTSKQVSDARHDHA